MGSHVWCWWFKKIINQAAQESLITLRVGQPGICLYFRIVHFRLFVFIHTHQTLFTIKSTSSRLVFHIECNGKFVNYLLAHDTFATAFVGFECSCDECVLTRLHTKYIPN